MRAARESATTSRRGKSSSVAVGNYFVIPHSWAEDFSELSEWAGCNAYWKVVHTAGFEPLITIESRVRVERVEFSRARFLELIEQFRIDAASEISEDFWRFCAGKRG